MTFENRSIMVSFIILLSLMSAGCGQLRIGVSAGDTSGSSSYTESLGAKINDQIHESTALSGSSLSQSFSGSGDRAETFSVTNNAEDYAEVGFDIKNSNRYSGSYKLSPKTVKYAQATEKLDVNAADSIYAYAYASARDRYENAFLSLSITDVSLVGYSNSAYATLGKATVNQKMKSVTGESIWVNENAWKGLNYNDLDLFVGDEPYSPNYNDGILSGIQNSKLTDHSESAKATKNLAEPTGVVLTKYSGSATATDKMAEKKRTIGYLSANSMYLTSYAYNRNGDISNSLVEISNGQLSKYSMTTTAIQTATKTSVNINSAQGSFIDVQSNAGRGIINSVVESYIENGDIKGYTTSAETAKKVANPKMYSVDSRQKFTSASGTSLSFNANANKGLEGLYYGSDYGSTTKLNIYGGTNCGSIKGYEISANTMYLPSSGGPVTYGSTTTSQNIKSASGSLIHVQAHAENRNVALEYGDGIDGNTLWVPTYYGGADFEVRATALANTKLVTGATSSNVVITPTLPKSIKTAIMLEPFRNMFVNYAWLTKNGKTYYGTTDLGTTVFPDLVEKGYATLRYTDSGASSDKFQNLGQYDVVLVNGHMDRDNIGLSTTNPKTKSNLLPASQLNYKSSKKTLVILAGCDSFGGYPTKSGLANAVDSAYLSGGFTETIFVTWMQDYLSYFFEALKNGDSASSANSYAYNQAGVKWGKGHGRTQLGFYPATGNDFKL